MESGARVDDETREKTETLIGFETTTTKTSVKARKGGEGKASRPQKQFEKNEREKPRSRKTVDAL